MHHAFPRVAGRNRLPAAATVVGSPWQGVPGWSIESSREGGDVLAIDIENGLEQAWARIATFVPKLLGFFAILLIGYFVAKALARVTDALLERIGFDGWVERGSLATAFQRSKFDPSDILAVVVFWAVFLIALQ